MLHEYTHGLSNRLVGGGVGISALQPGGMGEGWSDFYGLALLSEPGDDVNGNYAAGGYATYQLGGPDGELLLRHPALSLLDGHDEESADASRTSIRRRPVRTPAFRAARSSASTAERSAQQGEVWCVTLWDARANLDQQARLPPRATS